MGCRSLRTWGGGRQTCPQINDCGVSTVWQLHTKSPGAGVGWTEEKVTCSRFPIQHQSEKVNDAIGHYSWNWKWYCFIFVLGVSFLVR